jgi:2-polyprenyl-6-methoxyphenol hydroxylase-like FAD-dependent oxidoreductase
MAPLPYDLVIGTVSVVGALAFVRHRRCTVNRWWRSLAPVRPEADQPAVPARRRVLFRLRPVGSDHTYGSETLWPGFARRRAAPLACANAAHFGDIVREYPARLAEIHVRRSSGWARSTGAPVVVLIGDAAHASSPMMGQGGSLAVEDAGVLADSPERPTPWTGARAFVVRRRPRVRWVREQSRIAASLWRPVSARMRCRGAGTDDAAAVRAADRGTVSVSAPRPASVARPDRPRFGANCSVRPPGLVGVNSTS